jgi:outer membrane protein
VARAAGAGQGHRETERATALAISLQVRAAFFDARANKALVVVAKETLENLVKHLEQIEAFVAAGTRPDIDVFQARSDAANGRVQLITAENAYSTSRANLNQAMGVEGAIDYDVSDEALAAVPAEDDAIDPLLAEALKARPEFASLDEQLRAQQLTIRSVEGQYGPSISANAAFTQGGTALDHYGWNASIGVGLTWPIYQGGLTNATKSEAEHNAANLQAQIDVLRQQVRLEVEQVRLAVVAAKTTIAASKEALDNAKQRLALAEGRYEQGIGNIIELGDAQVALTTASAELVQADFRLATARAQLIKALGRP